MKTRIATVLLALALATLPAASAGDGEPGAKAGGGAEEKGKITIVTEGDITVQGEIETGEKPPVKVDLDFAKTDVREAVAAIAKLAGVKVDVDEKVKGDVTLTLEKWPWRSALIRVAKAAKAVLVPQKDGSFRIVPEGSMFIFPDGTTFKLAEHKVTWLPSRPTKIAEAPPALKLWGKPLEYAVRTPVLGMALASPAANDKVLANLRAALKTLKAAGLEKEAKAVEAEIARREAARKPLVYVASANLTAEIAALRADVAALRKEVRELTALVRKLAEEEK